MRNLFLTTIDGKVTLKKIKERNEYLLKYVVRSETDFNQQLRVFDQLYTADRYEEARRAAYVTYETLLKLTLERNYFRMRM